VNGGQRYSDYVFARDDLLDPGGTPGHPAPPPAAARGHECPPRTSTRRFGVDLVFVIEGQPRTYPVRFVVSAAIPSSRVIRSRGPVAAAVVLSTVLVALPARAAMPPKLLPPQYTREQMEAALAGARPFRFVYGTRDPAFTATLRARATALAVRAFGGDSTQVVADRDASDTLIAAGPIYLVGRARRERGDAAAGGGAPGQVRGQCVPLAGQLYDRPRDAIHLSWPNPLAPNRFLLLSAATRRRHSPMARTSRSPTTTGGSSATACWCGVAASRRTWRSRGPTIHGATATARPSATAT
jgi:hypothetical protein